MINIRIAFTLSTLFVIFSRDLITFLSERLAELCLKRELNSRQSKENRYVVPIGRLGKKPDLI